MKGGKVENCSRIKDENGRLAQEEDEVQKICKKNFEDLYNIDYYYYYYLGSISEDKDVLKIRHKA